MTFVRRNPLVSFFVLAYGLSWAYWIPLALVGVRTAPGSSTTHEPGLLGPALAAFIITGLTEGGAGVVAVAKRLVIISWPTSRFLIYSFSPLIFLGLAIVVAIVMHAPLPPWNEFAIYSGLPPLGLPAVLLLVLLFNGFGEEAVRKAVRSQGDINPSTTNETGNVKHCIVTIALNGSNAVKGALRPYAV